MKAQPKRVDLIEDRVEIEWSDGLTTQHEFSTLRQQCPCATCRTEREKLAGSKGLQLRVINSANPLPERALVVEWSPVGRYALSFRFNDGHATGIYSYQSLRQQAGAPV